LLLTPGGVQIYYGDESGRRFGETGSDGTQGTRSDMNWATTDQAILDHWKKLGTFRKKHAAVGAGTHSKLSSPAGTYAFARKLDSGGAKDAVVVALTATP
jgi:alpha-amylase